MDAVRERIEAGIRDALTDPAKRTNYQIALHSQDQVTIAMGLARKLRRELGRPPCKRDVDDLEFIVVIGEDAERWAPGARMSV